MDASTSRTLNIRALVASSGGPASWAEKYGGTRWVPAQVSQWISADNPKSIGNRLARDLEKKMGLKVGALDIFDGDASIVAGFATAQDYTRLQLLEGGAGMGDGMVNEDYPEVIREVEISNTELRKKLGFLPAPGRIQLITGRGPSMYPDIEDGEVVAVDTQINFFDGDDFYLININGMTQIKQLQMRPDGLHVVSSNPRFQPYRVDSPDEIAIGGKAILGLRVHRLGV